MRRVVLILALLLLPTGRGRALGYPYLAARLIDDSLTGPTDAHLTALHYNPAALRLLEGFHVAAYASALGSLGSFTRDAPLPAGFTGDGSTSADRSAAIRWVAPGSFVGASWDLGSESVTLAIGFYTPYVDRTDYGQDRVRGLPTRYYGVSDTTYSLWGSAGAALRITSWLSLGVGFNFAWTHSQMNFLRDRDPGGKDTFTCDSLGGTPCEQWQNRQEISLDVSGWGYGFSAGVLLMPLDRPAVRLWVSASYVSALLTSDGTDVGLNGSPQGACPDNGDPSQGAVLRTEGQRPTCGGAELIRSFPHLIYFGARARFAGSDKRWHPSSWELASYTRLAVPPRPDLELRLERRSFPALPDLLYLPMSLRTSVAINVDVRQSWKGRLVLGESFLYESPHSGQEAVTPANLDGHRLDLAASARVRLTRWLWLSAGVGVTWVLVSDHAGEGFQPGLAGTCRKKAYDITTPECQQVQDGWALPPISGSTTLAILHGGAGLGVDLR